VNGALLERIQRLKDERRAVILAHNYQLPDVQDVADFSGDSLELSRKAVGVDAEVVVFCGVHFMAETAAILNPGKAILLPVLDAGCPMADMVTAEQVRALRREHPDAQVVCYVNSSAAVKAESDCCCTSANALDVVQMLPGDRPIAFVPDRNLGEHVAEASGRELIQWDGYCPVHAEFTAADVDRARSAHPAATVMVHPECPGEVRHRADEVVSTGQMCRVATASAADEFIVGTEVGILHRLRKENPAKTFYPLANSAECEDMKRIDLPAVLDSLEHLRYRVVVDAPTATAARRAIDRMLEAGAGCPAPG